MTFSLEEVLGAELMRADKKERVLRIIEQLPQSPQDKRRLFSRWCTIVHCDMTEDDLRRLAASLYSPWKP